MSVLKDYFAPSDEILEDIENAEIFYQYMNQKKVKLYGKKKLNYFSGTIGEHAALEEITNIIEARGKFWSPLLKAIYLVERTRTVCDLRNLTSMKPDQFAEAMKIIRSGCNSLEELKNWIAPLSAKENIIPALIGATKVKIGEEYNSQFHILKLHEFEEAEKEGSIEIFDEVLSVENPEELIRYFTAYQKASKEKIKNRVFLAIQKNKLFDFKGVFFIFLVYKGILYSTDSMERRANLFNVAGERNPDRYLEEEMRDVWLPFNLLFDKTKKTDKLAVRESEYNVRKIAKLSEIFAANPEIEYWMEMFIYRVIESILTIPVEEGMMLDAGMKMLGDGKIDIEKIKEERKVEMKGELGRNDYLIDLVGKKIDSLAVAKPALPAVLGSKKFLKDIVKFEENKFLAKQMENEIQKDFKEKSNKIYKNIKKTVLSKGIEWVAIRSLRNLSYTHDHWEHFADASLLKNGEEYKTTILSVSDTFSISKWSMSQQPHFFSFFRENEEKSDYNDPLSRYRCCACETASLKKEVDITFRHWKAFAEFFEITEADIPQEMKDHLHTRNSLYVGNDIIDDVDPVELIEDPWFPDSSRSDDHSMKLILYLCQRCYAKFKRRAEEKNTEEGVPPEGEKARSHRDCPKCGKWLSSSIQCYNPGATAACEYCGIAFIKVDGKYVEERAITHDEYWAKIKASSSDDEDEDIEEEPE